MFFQEEATYATQKLADVIMDLHRSKESQKHSKQDSPKRQAKSPHKTSSLRSLKSSPITKKSRNKPPSFQNSDSLQEEVGEDDDSYDEDDFDEESHLNISVGPLSVGDGTLLSHCCVGSNLMFARYPKVNMTATSRAS